MMATLAFNKVTVQLTITIAKFKRIYQLILSLKSSKNHGSSDNSQLVILCLTLS